MLQITATTGLYPSNHISARTISNQNLREPQTATKSGGQGGRPPLEGSKNNLFSLNLNNDERKNHITVEK
jgi:hypothetical protein